MRRDLSAEPRVGLIALILGAFALRVIGLDRLGLAYDEAATALMSRATPAEIVAFHWHAAFEHPPLWILLMNVWSAFVGQSVYALRFIPALAGVLLVPAVWRLACTVWPETPPLSSVAAALVATAPVLVYYSQEARMYALVILLAILTTQLAFRLEEGRRNAVLFVVATWAMVGLHYYSAQVTALQALALYVQLAATRGRRQGRWLRLSVLFAFAGAPLVAWTVLAPGFRETLGVVRATSATSATTWEAFFDDTWRELVFGAIRWLPPQSVLSYALLPLVGVGAVYALRQARRPGQLLVTLLALFPLLSAVLLLRTLSTRYILYCVPFLLVLVALAVVRLGMLRRWIGGLALAIAFAISALGLVYYTGGYIKSAYRDVASDLAQRVDPADIVVLEAPRQHLLAKYYFPSGWRVVPVPEIELPAFWPVTAPPVTPEQEDGRVQEWLAQHPAVWVVYAGEAEVDRGEFLAKYIAAVAYTQDCDRRLDVRVCHYLSPHFRKPEITAVTDLRYGGELAITGAALSLYAPVGTSRPQDVLVQLNWRALTQPTVDSKASVRLYDSASVLVAQSDELPIGPLLPPTTWAAGDSKPGFFTLALPAELPPSEYRITVSLYRTADLQDIPSTNAEGASQPGPYVLAVLHVGDTMHLLPAR